MSLKPFLCCLFAGCALPASGGVAERALPAAAAEPATGAPWKLVFRAPPSTTPSGAAIAPAIQVALVDLHGDPAEGALPVTLALADNPVGGTLFGPLTAVALGGIATFDRVSLDKAGSYSMIATAAGLEPALSSELVIVAGDPARLRFLDAPANGVAGALLGESRVEIDDAAGNRVPGASDPITLSLGANPSGATLTGTLTANPLHGVATFDDVRIDRSGDGYCLDAASIGMAGAASAAFDVTP